MGFRLGSGKTKNEKLKNSFGEKEQERRELACVEMRNSACDAGKDFPRDGLGPVGDLRNRKIGAEEFDFVAGLAVGEVGYIGHDLVHGDSSQERGFLAADENVGALAGDVARIAVTIPGPDGGHGGFLCENTGATVADAVALRESANERDPGLERHHRAQLFLPSRKRRDAVKHEAGADKIGGGRLIIEKARAVRKVDIHIPWCREMSEQRARRRSRIEFR